MQSTSNANEMISIPITINSAEYYIQVIPFSRYNSDIMNIIVQSKFYTSISMDTKFLKLLWEKIKDIVLSMETEEWTIQWRKSICDGFFYYKYFMELILLPLDVYIVLPEENRQLQQPVPLVAQLSTIPIRLFEFHPFELIASESILEDNALEELNNPPHRLRFSQSDGNLNSSMKKTNKTCEVKRVSFGIIPNDPSGLNDFLESPLCDLDDNL